MRDCWKNRAGYDRVLLAVAAIFLTVSAASAQSDTTRSSPAELAIDAAVPRPEPANVPPPTPSDFKLEASQAAEAATPAVKPPTNAATESGKVEATKSDAASVAPASAPEPVQAAGHVASPDQPVANRLHDLIGAKSARYFDRKAERTAVEKFYTAREFTPVWTQSGKLTNSGQSVVARLKDAASDGLNPSDYPLPDFASATTPEALADAELKLTASMLDYARHAQSGRMHWSQVSGDIQYPEHPTDPAEVLSNVTSAKDASLALDNYNPPHKLYRELKKKLAELRGEGNGPTVQIADGPALKFTPARGKNQPTIEFEDDRVPQLRVKLNVTENPDDRHYDANVAEAVRKFQAGADLKPTGVLDDKTVKALNSPKRDRQIDTVIVNMERWRWLPRDLGAPSIGDAYVILNIPDYTLKVMQNGAQVWTTKVVAGQPGIHATPLLTETMKFITVNPTWNVPPSIIYNEYLPALQQDPNALERMGLKLEHNRDGSIHISQPPGERNALGRIRFNFPNKFLVYQHDTPDKHLFAREDRAFSHGCMRVQNPDQYASILLGITEPNAHYTPEKIRGMYGQSEIDLKFPTPIPVNITYQTAFVDDAGTLQIRKDVYGRDATMLSLLHSGRNKDLENVVAHSQPNYVKPTAIPDNVRFASDTSSSGPSFFERLFGGGSTPQPAPPAGRKPPPRRLYER
ncbi:MAG TPA: L,D-transpeptidase family protein [Bradyrhizobium sp.]|nr:L,D-transpeptidase family protein [Bradyrhizobium sp.]